MMRSRRAGIGYGTASLLSSQLLVGIAFIGLGVAGIGLGTALLLFSQLLVGIAAIGAGMALIGLGTASLLRSQLLVGVALIGLGVAVIGYGAVFVQRSTNLLARLQALTADPGEPEKRGNPRAAPRGRRVAPPSISR